MSKWKLITAVISGSSIIGMNSLSLFWPWRKDFNVRQGASRTLGRVITSFQVNLDPLRTVGFGRTDFSERKKTRIPRFQLIINVRDQTGWFWHVTVSRYMTGWHFRVIWPWNDLQATFDCTVFVTRSFNQSIWQDNFKFKVE